MSDDNVDTAEHAPKPIAGFDGETEYQGRMSEDCKTIVFTRPDDAGEWTFRF